MVKKFHSEKGEISYWERPGEKGAICLLHGNSSSSEVYSTLTSQPVLDGFHLFSFDFSGHGNSTHLPSSETYSIPLYAGVVREFSESIIDAPCVYFGHSLGGHILLESVPLLKNALGIGLLGTPPVSDAASLQNAYLPRPEFGCFFKSQITDEELKQLLDAAPLKDESLRKIVSEIVRKTDPRARDDLAKTVGMNQFRDEVQVVGTIQVPLAIAVGEKDPFINLDYVSKLKIPTLWNSGIHKIPGAGHYTQLDSQEKFAEFVSEYATECFSG